MPLRNVAAERMMKRVAKRVAKRMQRGEGEKKQQSVLGSSSNPSTQSAEDERAEDKLDSHILPSLLSFC